MIYEFLIVYLLNMDPNLKVYGNMIVESNSPTATAGLYHNSVRFVAEHNATSSVRVIILNIIPLGPKEQS